MSSESNIMVYGSISAGHCFEPKKFLNGSDNVLINRKRVGRLGDAYNSGIHSCGDSSHEIGKAAEGYQKVFVNKKPIHLIGDAVSCGDKAGKSIAQKVRCNGG